MKFSIIITTLNKHRFVQQRLFEIYKYIPEEYIEEIVITNDDALSEEMEKVVSVQRYSSSYPIISLSSLYPTSFSANVNRGVDYSRGEFILITQDDVQISGNFMTGLEIALANNNEHSVLGRVLDYDTGWNNIHGQIIPYIEGWFIACSREIWDDIGGMDEGIKPYDAEDIEWSIRVKQKGYNLVNYTSCYLRHIGGQTIQMDSNRRVVTEKNIEYIRNKWSREELGEIYG